MNFYCKDHPDFEGLNLGKVHDHIEKDHPEVVRLPDWRAALKQFFADKIEQDDMRRSDQRMVVRTWGRPPKMGQFVTDSEIEKKG